LNHLITLSSINDLDFQKVGQRAIDLSSAYKSKMNVPLSFIVPNLAFYEFLLQNKLMLEIRKIINNSDKTDESLENVYSQIKFLFESATIPEEFKEEFFEAYEALSQTETHSAQALLEGDEPVVNLIISPSYNVNSEKLSGVIFNIQGFDNFLNGLKSCWLSLYSPEHLKFREKNNIDEFTTGIIVQAFTSADCTVDAYSKSIIGNYDIPINAYFGLPDITYKIDKDHYSVSKESFGIVLQDIKHQGHILLRNIKSGTLLKRSLGSKGLVQKIEDKQILEIARNIERLSVILKLHFRIILFVNKSKNTVFFIDRIGERTPESEQEQRNGLKEKMTPSNLSESIQDIEGGEIKIVPSESDKNQGESLAELINSPVYTDDSEKKQESALLSKEAFAWETTINSNENSEAKKKEKVKAIILDDQNAELLESSKEMQKSEQTLELNKKIIILDNNDEFILSPKKEKSSEYNAQVVDKSESEGETNQSAKASTSLTPTNPDNEFFMSIILDIEPALDQEIMKRYQSKFDKVPVDVNIALEELSSTGEFPENEQVVKLKTMKNILERGETINLEVFLEVTEQLRKLI
jgi:hypothetical protein